MLEVSIAYIILLLHGRGMFIGFEFQYLKILIYIDNKMWLEYISKNEWNLLEKNIYKQNIMSHYYSKRQW